MREAAAAIVVRPTIAEQVVKADAGELVEGRRGRATPSRARVAEDQERVRLALQQLRSTVREMTPANRIRSEPYGWIAGAFVLGLVVGAALPRRW